MIKGNIDIEKAKEAAIHTAEKMNQPVEEQKSFMKNLMDSIESINPQLGGFEELAMIISLPDEHFTVLAPIFLDELERSFNNVTDKTALAQALNVANVRLEDLQDQYHQLLESIDKEMTNVPANRIDFLKQMISITFNGLMDSVGIAKRYIEIPIEVMPGAKMPTYANDTDAGMDIYALEDITIAPGETKLIKTGLKVALPKGYELQVRPKSGRALKTKLRVANTPGTIDSGYRDEIGVIIENIDPPIRAIHPLAEGDTVHYSDIEFGQSYTIGKGEKFAQLVLSEVPKAVFYTVDSIKTFEGDRGGGFGSTGLK